MRVRELLGQRIRACRALTGVFTRHTLGLLVVVLTAVMFADAASAEAVDVRISASRDDAEEGSDGEIVIASSDLELVRDRGDEQT
ncbi:MAG: hypothetical protein PVF85_10350, partial [Anaerolineales bacterium]